MQLGNKVAVELAPYGITVNNIAPAAPMDASLEEHPYQMETLLSEIPLGRRSTFFIDGGMTRQSGSL